MKLTAIREKISADPTNAWAAKKGWKPVYTAHESAKILIVGQAPGIRAQESGIPWNDPSGNNLRNWMSISRETFYDETKIALVPMDFFFPGSQVRGDAPPRKGFAARWHPLILEHMPHIQLTLLVGQYAQQYYLGSTRNKTLTETVKNYHQYLPKFFPLVHPSPRNALWQKKNPWFYENVTPELRTQIGPLLM